MKTIKILTALVLMLSISFSVSAQELSKSEMKAAKKTVKALEKDGWKVKPGSLSLFDQQVRARQAQLETDNEGMGKWVIGDGSSVSNLYDAAKLSATTIAKNALVSAINSNTILSNDNSTSNDQSEAEGKAVVEEVGKTTTSDINTLRTKTLMECYRDLPGGKIEVRVMLAIPASQANKINKKR